MGVIRRLERVPAAAIFAILETIPEVDEGREVMKQPSFFGWYEILRTRHRWSVLQSFRFALWLARAPENQQAVRYDRRLESGSESRGTAKLF